MNRTFSALFVSIFLTAGLVSCGSSSTKSQSSSGLKFRAFVSNPVHLGSTGAIFPALEIVDATKDTSSPFFISLAGTVADAGMMVESPKRDRTFVFSPASNAVALVTNSSESASGTLSLPGPTESMFVWTDNTTLFAAVPDASIVGQPAGAVVEINGSNTATIPVPGAHFLVPSPSGNQILVLSDSANTVSVLAPALIPNGNPLTTVSGNFDKPVWAVFSSDGSTAYVMNCGPECGGTAASIAEVDMTQTPPAVTSQLTVQGATTGLLNGGNLYVAGTPPSSGANCQATLCGVLTVLPGANLSSTPATFAVSDGYHNHIVSAPNGQLFIGSRNCTTVAAGSTPARGCLSVLNTAGSSVYVSSPSQLGNVTGIQPILNRTVVYVCEGGALTIYDTTSDLGSGGILQPQKTQVTITGQPIDVKLADF